MTTIKTTCEFCGDVELVPEDLSLDLDPARDRGSYHFQCPLCVRRQFRPANSRVVSILLATGVSYRVSGDRPITEAEIESFSRALDNDDWLRHLLTS
ncbi:MAG: hypothetical protein ACRDWX_06475 [Acidimicrobiia bacterium]